MKKLLHRVWAEINLDALGQNIRNIKEYTGNKEIMAVVKANAYGHGVALVAPELYRLGITRFSVSNIGEARELRELLPQAEILVFGGELSREDFGDFWKALGINKNTSDG